MTGDEPMNINREDMMELTRRMTLSRNCFSRLAGAYMDEEGFIDGTFPYPFSEIEQSRPGEKSEACQGYPLCQNQ